MSETLNNYTPKVAAEDQKRTSEIHAKSKKGALMTLQRRLSLGSASLQTYRELWMDRDRPEILQLLDGPADYDAGPIKLLIPRMDRLSTIDRFRCHLAVYEAELIKRKCAAADIIRTPIP